MLLTYGGDCGGDGGDDGGLGSCHGGLCEFQFNMLGSIKFGHR